jgi:hypothetical protein
MKATARIILYILILSTSAFAQTKKDSLLVFVGEKINIKLAPEEISVIKIDTNFVGKDTVLIERHSIGLDSKYIANYKILKFVHGFYISDTIEFIAYDHYGVPEFSNFKTVLLFLTFKNGKIYHEKYQFFDLYLTSDNKWASSFSSYDYNHPFKNEITIKPTKMTFINEVSYPINNLNIKEIRSKYPKPYYKIKKDKAIAIYGNYVEELFKLKQQTVLKARGIY